MMNHIKLVVETIFYVSDQHRSAEFYSAIFRTAPDLHVPGMTEFVLSEHCKLGLMPNKGIAKILGDHLPHPDLGNGIPRCELYLVLVENVELEYENAVKSGARLISGIQDRDWGDRVCYFADMDGHVIAFAEKI